LISLRCYSVVNILPLFVYFTFYHPKCEQMPDLHEQIKALNKEIFACENKKRGYRRVTERLDVLASAISAQKDACEKAQQRMERERDDVISFDDRITLFGILFPNSKRRRERLDREYLEFEFAKFSFLATKKRLQSLEREEKNLKRKLERLRDGEDCLQEMLDKKAELLKNSGGKVANIIKQLDKKIVARKLFIKEMREAVRAGEKAIDRLTDLRKKLEDMKLWALFGGDVIVHDPSVEVIDLPENKKTYFHELEDMIFIAGYAMDKFEREFSDVYPGKKRDFDNVDEVLSFFLEIFFLNFVTDMVVQTELRFTIMHVENAAHDIRSDITPMGKHIFDSKMAIDEYEKIKRRIIKEAEA